MLFRITLPIGGRYGKATAHFSRPRRLFHRLAQVAGRKPAKDRRDLRRNAYIYVRQSSEHQVRDNIESRQRQYELANLARQFSWGDESIMVIDDDLGKSASSSLGRSGFAKLVADVALGKAGIIFGLEVSRLAGKNNRDWYQLLDLCSLAGTLIFHRTPG